MVTATDRIAGVLSNGVRWTGALATEVALLPATIRHLREAVLAIALLPPEIERLNVALAEASGTLEAHVPELSRVVVGDLSGAVAALNDVLPKLETVVAEELRERVEHLDVVVSELSTTLTGALGTIPGVRRSVRAG